MTQQEAYDHLANFIQDYIYQKGWEALTPLQIATIEALETMDHNLLLMAGTAQGKTEAAFLPAISFLFHQREENAQSTNQQKDNLKPTNQQKDNPQSSNQQKDNPQSLNQQKEDLQEGIGILYISPLKALINDQFLRIEDMLKDTGLTITKWHGDASDYGKEKLLENPVGILQMTPESLEAMICCHPERVLRLFRGLGFVIIDEIHAFLGEQRGIQLMALLERIERMCSCKPVRMGLSATLHNPEAALEYLCLGSSYKGKILRQKGGNQQVMCSVTASRIGKVEYPERYFKKILKHTKGKRALLFCNSRKECERILTGVRQMAMEYHLPDVYHVHHGSISKRDREETERIMKGENGPLLTATTLTLELGIDIGDLDQVVQATDPPSIASMVQRLGRSGRRTGQSHIAFQLRYREDKNDFRKFDLSMVRSMAMIELYFREHYMEEKAMPRYPFRLFLHTILSYLCEKGCLQPRYLAQYVLELAVFRNISQEELKDLLLHLMDKDILMQYEDGAIGLSDRGEEIVNSLNFYAVFDGEEAVSVYHMGAEIGSVERHYGPGNVFYLAGKTWEVVHTDWERHRIDVVETHLSEEEEASQAFAGYGSMETDRRIMEKIHEILAGEESYAYLDEEAAGILADIRRKARQYHLLEEYSSTAAGMLFFPLEGSRTIETYYHILRAHDVKCQQMYCRELLVGIEILDPSISKEKISQYFTRDCEEKVLIDNAYIAYNIKCHGKYYDLLPDHLKVKEMDILRDF